MLETHDLQEIANALQGKEIPIQHLFLMNWSSNEINEGVDALVKVLLKSNAVKRLYVKMDDMKKFKQHELLHEQQHELLHEQQHELLDARTAFDFDNRVCIFDMTPLSHYFSF